MYFVIIRLIGGGHIVHEHRHKSAAEAEIEKIKQAAIRTTPEGKPWGVFLAESAHD